ncbi:hypothetical protein [Sanyastnella coralliicola]|uniref:hypothetical protein n=1 Tax=Sanyastnella coralliicola TaxID=3069118 RepID=UPI0027BA7C4D|nr:hypothetical protein [Longitalea sp. SCSIO 12813]
MKKTILLLFAISMCTFGFAQNDYNLGIGVRGGLASGLTIKKATGASTAVEGIFGFRWNSFQATVLFQRANNLGSDENLNLFYGLGGHIGSYGGRYAYLPDDYENGRFVNVGVDAILGVEYTFDSAPFALSLDVKPAIDLVYLSPIYMGAGLSLRYVIE